MLSGHLAGKEGRVEAMDSGQAGQEWAADYDELHRHLDPADTVAAVTDLADGGAVLELGVGTGRIALPLAARGVEVVGVDASAAMLQRLGDKPQGQAVETVEADFVDVTLDRRFAVVLVAFNTLFSVTSQPRQVAAVANAAGHLQPTTWPPSASTRRWCGSRHAASAPTRWRCGMPGPASWTPWPSLPDWSLPAGGADGTAARSPPPAPPTSLSTNTAAPRRHSPRPRHEDCTRHRRDGERDQPRRVGCGLTTADNATPAGGAMDGADLPAAMAELHRVVRPGGRLAFSILHPCFITPGSGWIRDDHGSEVALQVSDYFADEPIIEQWTF